MRRHRLVLAALTLGMLHGVAPLAREQQPRTDVLKVPEGSARLPAEFMQLLQTNPYAFFRFVNRPWASRVCDAFGRDRDALVKVRLHGDAHVEQYAFTDTAYGLDDFDDTAEGPAVIDLPTTGIVVPPGAQVAVSDGGNFIMTFNR